MLNTLILKKKKSDAVSTEAGIDSPFTVDPASRNIAAQNTDHRSQNAEVLNTAVQKTPLF